MDRFIKTLGILIVMLVLLASGINVTLDRLAASPQQNQLIVYSGRDNDLLVYTGDLRHFAEGQKIDTTQMPRLLRRVKAPVLVPPASNDGYRWL